jgi:hypothetical protein
VKEFKYENVKSVRLCFCINIVIFGKQIED